MNVPQTEAIKFDLERWLDVRQRQPLSTLQVQTTSDPSRDAVMRRLESTVITPKFGDEDEGSPSRASRRSSRRRPASTS